MADESQPDAAAAKVQVSIVVGLEGIVVRIPPAFWLDPSLNLIMPSGNRRWMELFNAMVQTIASGLGGFIQEKGFLLENGALVVPASAFAPKPDAPADAPKKPMLTLVTP